jgi:hypothetical protein
MGELVSMAEFKVRQAEKMQGFFEKERSTSKLQVLDVHEFLALDLSLPATEEKALISKSDCPMCWEHLLIPEIEEDKD